jgi:PKD repeat protein
MKNIFHFGRLLFVIIGFALSSCQPSISGSHKPSDKTISAETCGSLKTDGSNFSSSVNPTGNPVGGGRCYNKIIFRSTANFIVNNKSKLKSALSKAKSGQVIYVDDDCELDLSAEKNLVIPEGVTLASGRGNGKSNGALLFSGSLFPEKEFVALFVTGGKNVRITGLRFRGPSPDILDHDSARGVANAIRCLHTSLEVDNCELWAWNKWAIWLYVSDQANIHHNYIHHTMLAGYGYPVWCGGSNETNANALIEANLFEAGRHTIASSGHPNSWEARYNVILRRQLYVNFNRHSQGKTNTGGLNTHIHHNLVFSTQEHFGLALPLPGATDEINNNWLMRDSVTAFGEKRPKGNSEPSNRIRIHDNYFNGSNRVLPVAKISSSVDSGTAPLTVQFDSHDSYDSEGGKILNYQWRFGDGDYSGNEQRIASPIYTFKEPGIYTISLLVFNEYGIPGNQATKKIIVRPKTGKYFLSAWVKDSYPGEMKGRYMKQLLVDSTVVWEDDVAGNEGWQHIVKDISFAGNGGSTHRIAARLKSVQGIDDPKKEITELFMWVDDFYVFNTNEQVPDFETEKITPYWNTSFDQPKGIPNAFSVLVTTADSRSGEQSLQIRIPFQSRVLPGISCDVYQQVVFR